jgi:hypothetical protein
VDNFEISQTQLIHQNLPLTSSLLMSSFYQHQPSAGMFTQDVRSLRVGILKIKGVTRGISLRTNIRQDLKTAHINLPIIENSWPNPYILNMKTLLLVQLVSAISNQFRIAQ